MRSTALVLACLMSVLVACDDGRVRPAQDMRRVAVVPVAGETLQLARIGQLPFADRRAKFGVGNWNLQDEAYRAVKELLERGGRFMVLRLDASPEVFPALHAAAARGHAGPAPRGANWLCWPQCAAVTPCC
jgi:hypothetical protein